MRKDKKYIIELRKGGKSYREIQKETGVSRATLSAWFKDALWSKHTEVRNRNMNLEASTKRIIAMNSVRKQILSEQYASAEEEATVNYEQFKYDPLFWAGLMIYGGQGDKRSKVLIRISTSEFYLHKIYIHFLVKYLAVPMETLRCALILYPDHNESLCKEMWVNVLRIPRDQFHKTQVIKGKEKVRRLQYGVGMTILTSTALKKKLMKWLSLAQDERFE